MEETRLSLVLEPAKVGDEPYTTSAIIAEGTGINHRRVRDAIRKYMNDLESFGKVGAYQTPLPESKTGQSTTGYILNEQQATFLLTLLKNTPVVVAFKKELVRQFYRMRNELSTRHELRDAGKQIRRSLTDSVRDSGENDRMHGHGYSTYTDLAFMLALGKRARDIRKERGASKDAKAVDLLTAAELKEYYRKEAAINALLDAGWKYDNIKIALSGAALPSSM